MPRDLWETGASLAENKDLGKRIRHSAFADPFRRKSASRIGKKLVSGAISFIPIPVVKSLVDAAVSKGLAIARGQQKKYKLGKHAQDTEKAVKWGWKDLSVEEMDRYRWKIHHGSVMLKQAWQNALDNQDKTASPCNDWGRAIAKYVYLQSRIQKMREKVCVLKELIETTELWLNDVSASLDNNGVEAKLKEAASKINEIPAEGHLKCDKTMCIHGSDKRFVEKHKKAAGAMQTTTSLVVEIAPTPLTKSPYTEGYYKGS